MPDARSVKIVLRSGKSQGIFWVLMSGNPDVDLGRCIIRLTVMCTFNKINIKETSHAFDELFVRFGGH